MAICKGYIRSFTHTPKPTSKTQQNKVAEPKTFVSCEVCGRTDKTLYREHDHYVCKEHRGN